MSGYSANPAAAMAVAEEMRKTAQTLAQLNEDLNAAARASLSEWEASAKAAWHALQTKLNTATTALSDKGLMAGSSVGSTIDAIVRTDRTIANLY